VPPAKGTAIVERARRERLRRYTSKYCPVSDRSFAACHELDPPPYMDRATPSRRANIPGEAVGAYRAIDPSHAHWSLFIEVARFLAGRW
jgi:hypothetical protein